MFTVLWIDDLHDQQYIFKKEAKYKGIQLICVDNYIAGEKWLEANKNICRAVILDVECKLASDSSTANIETFRTRTDITKLCNIYNIPLYIFTGYDYEDADKIKDVLRWNNEIAYCKSESAAFLDKLVSDLENTTIGQLEKKYSEILEFAAPKKEELLRVMLGIKQGDSKNTDHLNNMRKIIEWIFDSYLNEYGFVPSAILSSKGKVVSESRKFIEAVNKVNKSIVPDYIHFALQACENATQEGSHNNLCVEEDVKIGKAPYLIESTLNNLLTILWWVKSLPTESAAKEVLLDLLGKTGVYREGLIQIDDNRQYYVEINAEKIKVQPKNKKLEIGIKILIKSSGVNKDDDGYNYYSNTYDIVQE